VIEVDGVDGREGEGDTLPRGVGRWVVFRAVFFMRLLWREAGRGVEGREFEEVDIVQVWFVICELQGQAV
jgi:hypothetical protein